MITDLNKIVDEIFKDNFIATTRNKYIDITCDAFSIDNGIVIEFEVPRYTKDDIKISITNDILTVIGELTDSRKDRAKFSKFTKRWDLSQYNLNYDLTETTLESGVLSIKFVKNEETKPKTIEVKIS